MNSESTDAAGGWAILLAAGRGPAAILGAVELVECRYPRERVLAVVGPHHLDSWKYVLSHLPAANILVQPFERGTAPAILLALMHLGEGASSSAVGVFPGDCVCDDVPPSAVERGQEAAERFPDRVIVLGVRTGKPAAPSARYIVPGSRLSRGSSAMSVASFARRARSGASARDRRRALQSTSILFGTRRAFARLFALSLPRLVGTFMESRERREETAEVYGRIAAHDFQREVLCRSASLTCVVPVAEDQDPRGRPELNQVASDRTGPFGEPGVLRLLCAALRQHRQVLPGDREASLSRVRRSLTE